YIGHRYGPNSAEVEDNYIRLDRDLGEFFRFLDSRIGKGQYLVFLSADHAVAHSTDFAKQHKIPGGGVNSESLLKDVYRTLEDKFGKHKLIEASINNQLFLDHHLIDSLKIDR